MEKSYIQILALSIVLSLIAGSAVTFAAMQWTQHIRNTAALKVLGVGIYKDVNFTVSVTEIDWGIVEPGEQKNVSAYIKNESNVPISLAMWTEKWTPENASAFIGLTWDYDGSTIDVDGVVLMTFMLDVSATISGVDSFAFTIVVVGSG